jgi:hypothetical protein
MFTHTHRDASVPAHQHVAVADARACEAANLHFTCDWLVKRLPVLREPGPDATSEDWDAYGDAMAYLEEEIVPCGAFAWADDRGWTCNVGHAHVTAEARYAEGWDYAHDEDEARGLRRNGVDAVAMDGGSI